MKKPIKLCICCVCAMLAFAGCKGCKQACVEKKPIAQTEKQDVNYLSYVDSAVKKLFGDTVSSVVFNPEQVTLLRLTPRPFASDDTLKKDTLPSIHGSYILKELAPSNEQISPILLLLSDADSYFLSDNTITMPFSPYLALCVFKGDKQVDIIFSIGGGRMKIYYKDFVSEEIKYIPERLVLKYFHRITQDPKLKVMIES